MCAAKWHRQLSRAVVDLHQLPLDCCSAQERAGGGYSPTRTRRRSPGTAAIGQVLPCRSRSPGAVRIHETARNVGGDRVRQFGLMPATLTTFPHISVASVMSFPKSADEPWNGMSKRSERLALIAGSSSAALT
jgi:hypothetical protein